MPKRRANGEGNIRKRKDGRWEGRYTVGHDPETGKAIIKNVLGKTQAGSKEKLKKAIEENVGIDYGKAKTYTVGDGWRSGWKTTQKIKLARPRSRPVKVSSRTISSRRSAASRWQISLLWTYNDSISTCWMVAGLTVSKAKKAERFGPKTVRNIHQMIGSAYNLAWSSALSRTKSNAGGCALPKVEHKGDENADRRPTRCLSSEAMDSGVFALYYIDLTTGLRRGELLGLKVDRR